MRIARRHLRPLASPPPRTFLAPSFSLLLSTPQIPVAIGHGCGFEGAVVGEHRLLLLGSAPARSTHLGRPSYPPPGPPLRLLLTLLADPVCVRPRSRPGAPLQLQQDASRWMSLRSPWSATRPPTRDVVCANARHFPSKRSPPATLMIAHKVMELMAMKFRF
ncbi:hypothetical protein SORBI_3002G073300 [Sorghum bicolor]|uniref:Uncharacterized protein n=1 Tax=Sorghum bicolor TaxID=4558 RepID=A0A1B6Q9P4_SORBI|nr:hypothetical protein SORBI_3002G073300 [Sorghum bicolor]